MADLLFIFFFFVFILSPLLLAWRLVNRDSFEVKVIEIEQEMGNGKSEVSRLTTLWRAVGNDEGFEVKVIDV